jgi:type II secretory pathway pseudopilin PulG
MNDAKTSQAGFTIVETMIVIGVSAFLFLSATLMVMGQQRKVEFTQSVQDLKSIVDQTISEVGTGYYPRTNNLRCTVVAGDVQINPAVPTGFGANTGCIFLGKAIQFGVHDTDPQEYYIHSIAGLQNNTGTLVSAKPKPINTPNITVNGKLHNGVKVTAMRYKQGASQTDIGAVAFINGLGDYSGGSLQSGSQQMMLVPINNSGTVTTGTTLAGVQTAIDNSMETSPVDPDGGVEICLNGDSSRWALITIGSKNRQLSAKLEFKSAAC